MASGPGAQRSKDEYKRLELEIPRFKVLTLPLLVMCHNMATIGILLNKMMKVNISNKVHCW